MTTITFDEMIHYLTMEGGIVENTSTGMIYRYNKELKQLEFVQKDLSLGTWRTLHPSENVSILKTTYPTFVKIEGIQELLQRMETVPINFHVRNSLIRLNPKRVYEIQKHPETNETYIVSYRDGNKNHQFVFDIEEVEVYLITGMWKPITY